MRSVSLKIPEIGLIAGTRIALGAGLGLLLADKLNRGQRKTIGRALLMIGGFSTVPLIAHVVHKIKSPNALAEPA